MPLYSTPQHEKLAESLSSFCDMHGIGELTCLFEYNGKSITLHIAPDGEPSPGYKAVHRLLNEVLELSKNIKDNDGLFG